MDPGGVLCLELAWIAQVNNIHVHGFVLWQNHGCRILEGWRQKACGYKPLEQIVQRTCSSNGLCSTANEIKLKNEFLLKFVLVVVITMFFVFS